MENTNLISRITINPEIFGGKPIIRNKRLAVEHVLGMLAAGDTAEQILKGYDWLEPQDIQACLLYAHKLVSHERVEFNAAWIVCEYSLTIVFGQEFHAI